MPFWSAEGGVSTGLYAGLNCGFGSRDDRNAVSENRRRALAAVGADRLATLYQIHSAEAVTLTEPPKGLRADGMATDRPGLALGILTADCAPVLFADEESAGVVGAAHGGWRGALAGIAEAVLERMEGLGARAGRTVAAVGPCIGQASYEVGPEFRTEFEAADPGQRPLVRRGRAARPLPLRPRRLRRGAAGAGRPRGRLARRCRYLRGRRTVFQLPPRLPAGRKGLRPPIVADRTAALTATRPAAPSGRARRPSSAPCGFPARPPPLPAGRRRRCVRPRRRPRARDRRSSPPS